MSNRHKETTEALRQWLSNRAGLEDMDDAHWALLCGSDWMWEWERAATKEERDEYRGYLLDELRRNIKALSDFEITGSGRYQTVQRRRSTRTVTLDPEGAIAARAEAMCLYWAKLADASREVCRFRGRTLVGEPLTQTDARNLIHSPAAAVMSKERFRAKKIPVVGHTAELLSYEGSKRFDHPYWTRVTIRAAWPEGEKVIRMSYEKPSEVVPLWDGKKLVPVAPWPYSILSSLYTLAAKLSRHYPWEPPMAAWFLLTGQPPWVPPLTAHIEESNYALNHTAITVTAAHWVPKDAEGRFYAEVKRRTNPTPTLSERRLALFRFVLERSSGMDRWEPKGVHVLGLDIPPWRSLLAQWNEIHPSGDEWHYKTLRNFHRDFREASKSILGY